MKKSSKIRCSVCGASVGMADNRIEVHQFASKRKSEPPETCYGSLMPVYVAKNGMIDQGTIIYNGRGRFDVDDLAING